jgi:capsular polysaccharide transport system ATP-binding protein
MIEAARKALAARLAGGAGTRRGRAEVARLMRDAICDDEEQTPGEKLLRVVDVVKDYETPIGRRRILDGISFNLGMGEKIAVLGRNGAGKSTLVKLLGGVEPPTRGSISRGLSMSWPLGFSGGVDGMMTGMSNVRFIARLYGRPVEEMVAFVDDFAELGRQLFVPVKHYSAGMRMRLAFALTLAIDFECILIDEVIAVGDQRFHRKCFDALFVKRAGCAMILVSHDIRAISQFCNKALVMKNGRARVFEDVNLALRIYETL